MPRACIVWGNIVTHDQPLEGVSHTWHWAVYSGQALTNVQRVSVCGVLSYKCDIYITFSSSKAQHHGRWGGDM